MSLILLVWRQRQEDHSKSVASLVYRVSFRSASETVLQNTKTISRAGIYIPVGTKNNFKRQTADCSYQKYRELRKV